MIRISKPNNDKLIPFLKRFDEGVWFYKDGKIYSKKRFINKFKVIDIEPTPIAYPNQRGYMRVSVRGTTAYEHRVIFALFHGLDELSKYETIDHINNIKSDNRIENLQGLSIKENSLKAEADGLVRRTYGFINGQTKLSEGQLKLIFELRNRGFTQYEIAKKLNISQAHVSNILNRKSRTKCIDEKWAIK